MACPASLVLPTVDLPTNPAAVEGTRIHADIEDYYLGKRGEAPFSGLPVRGEGVIPEVSFMFTGSRFREIGRSAGREVYDQHSRGNVFGTIDLVIQRDGELEIYDWKTGDMDVARPKENPQFLFAAAAVRDVLGFGDEEVKAHMVQIRDGKIARVKQDTLKPELLDKFVESLGNFVKLRFEADGNMQEPGPHCGFCRSAPYCDTVREPALVALRASGSASKPEKAFPLELGPHNAAEAWDALQKAEAFLSTFKQAIKAYIREGGIDLPSGKRVIAFRGKSQKPVARAAGELLKKKGLDPMELVTGYTTKKAIANALGYKTTDAKAVVSFLEELEAAGGVEEKVGRETIKEVGEK
jgi:hypothetical protein